MLSTEEISDEWKLDTGVRLAASELIRYPGSRAVVLVTSGSIPSGGLETYPADVLAAYMRNNGITFYCLYTVRNPENAEMLDYICRETGGESYFALRERGVSTIAEEVLERNEGRYFFTYRSTTPSNFGDAFIPVNAELVYYRRSGRGESGYFPPLEF